MSIKFQGIVVEFCKYLILAMKSWCVEQGQAKPSHSQTTPASCSPEEDGAPLLTKNK